MTPREYLSYSQLSMLERSEETYKRVYLNGEKSFSNSSMGFGSRIADLLEKDELTGDPEVDMVLAQIPRLDIPEHEIFAELRNGKNPVPLLAKPDSVSTDLSHLLEYKTGKRAWSQPKVDKADQLTFYATTIWLKTNKIPSMRLVWLETWHDTDEEGKSLPKFTGQMIVYDTQRHMTEILNMMQRMKNGWELIQKLTEEALI